MRTSCVVALCVATACTPTSPSAGLADLPELHIDGTETGLVFNYDNTVDCFALSTAVTGTVDGRPIEVTSRGGWRNTNEGNTCDPIWLGFPAPLDDQPETIVELADGETAWTLSVEGLAPAHWRLTASAVTEGQDFTATYAPATPGVAIQDVYIDRRGISPVVAQTADSMTVHVEAGYWSDPDPALHGTTIAGQLGASIGPLVIHGCAAPGGCALRTSTPDLPVSITVP